MPAIHRVLVCGGSGRQGAAVSRALVAHGVRHVVQSIMALSRTYDGIAHFESKQRIADRLRLGPLPFTTLGTVWFMDNILDPKMGGSMNLPILAGSLTSHVSFPMLATADIGKACVKILQSPSAHAGKHFDLIGDRLTVAEMKQVYTRVTGRRAKWYRMPRWVMRWINKEFAEQLAWHNRVDFDGQPDQLRKWLGETVTFEQFLRQHPNINL